MFARSQYTHLFSNFHVSNKAGKCSASNARSWLLRGISGRVALNVVGRPKTMVEGTEQVCFGGLRRMDVTLSPLLPPTTPLAHASTCMVPIFQNHL
jgi:hypothetical protein